LGYFFVVDVDFLIEKGSFGMALVTGSSEDFWLYFLASRVIEYFDVLEVSY